MIYFSELKDKQVFTEDHIKIGKLEDLIFLAEETPQITKLVIRNSTGNKIIVPVTFLKKINSFVTIKKDYSVKELEENELHIVKNILDKQIIDLQGNKIVRVNDIALQDKDGFYIAGVDIGLLGLLRWLKLEKPYFRIIGLLQLKPTSQFLSWADIQPLELARGQVKLKKEENRLAKLRPEDLADYLEETNIVNTRKILKILDEKFATQVISKLNLNYQASLFKQYKSDKAALIIANIDPDEAVDVLLTVTPKKRQEIIDLLPDQKKKEIEHLIKLSVTPIGSVLTTDYLTVYPENLVREVILKIKKDTSDFFFLNTIYVINKKDQLNGVFNLHELLLQDPETPVYKFMIQNVVVAHLTSPKEIVLKKMVKYRVVSIPVIDNNKQIQGVITLDDVVELIQSKLQ